jgi:menaquinone-dependent protoporphyrinogen oxidase
VADRVLVAYGSLAGSTAEIAAEIGKVLGSDGTQVDVIAAGRVADLSPYRAVVVGTAIRSFKSKPEVVRFAQEHQEELRRVPVALFGVGTYLDFESDPGKAASEPCLAVLRDLLQPVAITGFKGAMIGARLSLPWRLLAATQRQGDWRNWEAIRAWAESLRPLLRGDSRA